MTDTCWSCGVDQHPSRPVRTDFGSDPEYLIACLVYLDHAFPERNARAAEWRRLELEANPTWVRSRLRDLLTAEPTPADDAEFARLAEIYKSNSRKENTRS